MTRCTRPIATSPFLCSGSLCRLPLTSFPMPSTVSSANTPFLLLSPGPRMYASLPPLSLFMFWNSSLPPLSSGGRLHAPFSSLLLGVHLQAPYPDACHCCCPSHPLVLILEHRIWLQTSLCASAYYFICRSLMRTRALSVIKHLPLHTGYLNGLSCAPACILTPPSPVCHLPGVHRSTKNPYVCKLARLKLVFRNQSFP